MHDNVHVDVDVDVLVHVDVGVGGFCSIAPGLPLFISFTGGSLRLACDWVLLGAPASRLMPHTFWAA